MNEKSIKRPRWTAIVFGSLATLTLIAFVFAFIQQAEAKKQINFALEVQEKAQLCEIMQIKMMNKIEQQNQQLESLSIELEAAIKEAERLKQQVELKPKSRK